MNDHEIDQPHIILLSVSKNLGNNIMIKRANNNKSNNLVPTRGVFIPSGQIIHVINLKNGIVFWCICKLC